MNSQGDALPEPPSPLRDQIGEIRNVDGLRRAGELLARHLGLPRPPHIAVGSVRWKGPETPIIEFMGRSQGAFTIARWAVRGRYRRSWESLEYALVCAIGYWLESHRKESVFGDKGTQDALVAWYGESVGRPLAEAYERRSRVGKRVLIGLGLVLAVYCLLWAFGLVR